MSDIRLEIAYYNRKIVIILSDQMKYQKTGYNFVRIIWSLPEIHLAFVAFILDACSRTGVVPIASGISMMAKRGAHVDFGPPGGVKADAMKTQWK